VFALATTLGGATTTLGLWLLSGLSEPLPEPARWAVFALAVVALVLQARDVISFPLPQAARQIPREVFDRQPASAAARFGFALGTGVRTYMVSPVPYVPALAILLLAPPLVGALALGVGFGVARGLVPAGRTLQRRRAVRTPSVQE
jgi:hypothetical protein